VPDDTGKRGVGVAVGVNVGSGVGVSVGGSVAVGGAKVIVGCIVVAVPHAVIRNAQTIGKAGNCFFIVSS